MKLIFSRDGVGRVVWIAQSDDKEYDAIGPDPLSAISALADELEKKLKEYELNVN